MLPRRRLTLVSAAALTLGLAASAPAQPTAGTGNWPSRAIHLIVPFPAGSSPDLIARVLAEKLAPALGQPVIVENRPGGAGLIAAREAAKAAPDGHTMLLALINNAISDALNPDPCCRLNEALAPVSRFTMTPLVMVVHPSLQAFSLQQFISLGKEKPGVITFASSGPGSINQLVGGWIQSETGIRMLEVPYKAVNAELPDLIGGQVMAAFVVPQVVVASIKSGKLRALAVTAPARLASLPGVPTTAEAGLPGVEAIVWNGIFVPAGTPQPVIQVLHRELVRAYNAPEIKGQVMNTGGYVAADSPEEFAAFVRAENAKWSKVAREADIKGQ